MKIPGRKEKYKGRKESAKAWEKKKMQKNKEIYKGHTVESIE